jgi:hypothetical protein
LYTENDKNVYQIKSHSKCTIEKIINANLPKFIDVKIKLLPIVNHQIKKYGFEIVAMTPENIAP